MAARSASAIVGTFLGPPPRAMMGYLQRERDELHVEVEGLRSAYETMRNVADSRKAEVERLRAQLKAEHETAVAAIAGSEKENERLRTELDSEHLEYSLSLTNRDLRAEVSRLRAAITEALGGADCLPDHNMAEFCGWCMLREALSGDQAQHPGDQIQHEHGADPTQ